MKTLKGRLTTSSLVMAIMVGLVLGLVVPVKATPVIFNFSGTITGVTDNNNLLDGSIIVGDTYSGMLSYDSSLPDTVSDPTVYSSGSLSSSVTGVVTAGNYVFTGGSGTIDLQNKSSDSLLFLLPYTSTPPINLGSNPGRAIFLRFLDSSGTVFPNDSLPTNLDLNNFTSVGLQLFGDSGPGNPLFSVSGDTNSLNAIPEPSTMLLFGTGLAGLGLWRYRKSVKG